MPDDDVFRLSLPSVAASVSTARRGVAEHMTGMGCDAQVVVDATIAVGEAATNAVLHAYPDVEGFFQLTVRRDTEAVRVTLEDQGRGPGPNLRREGGGLGFPLMAELADRLTIEGGSNTGTLITLVFLTPPETG